MTPDLTLSEVAILASLMEEWVTQRSINARLFPERVFPVLPLIHQIMEGELRVIIIDKIVKFKHFLTVQKLVIRNNLTMEVEKNDLGMQ